MKYAFATASVVALLMAGPVLAQDPAKTDGPDIIVKQPPPIITVKPHAPDVTVNTEKPDVAVQQGQPEVLVDKPQPDVAVETGQPAVRVAPTERPDVTVVKPPAGTADVNVGTSAPPAAGVVERERAVVAPTEPAVGIFPMVAEVERLIGREVYGMRGEEVGEIENLLIGPDGRVRAAIIEFGGFLGIGENEVAVPWDRMNVAGDRVIVNMTEEQIKAEPRWTPDRPGGFAEYRPYR